MYKFQRSAYGLTTTVVMPEVAGGMPIREAGDEDGTVIPAEPWPLMQQYARVHGFDAAIRALTEGLGFTEVVDR